MKNIEKLRSEFEKEYADYLKEYMNRLTLILRELSLYNRVIVRKSDHKKGLILMTRCPDWQEPLKYSFFFFRFWQQD